jgi:hypothetical protein
MATVLMKASGFLGSSSLSSGFFALRNISPFTFSSSSTPLLTSSSWFSTLSLISQQSTSTSTSSTSPFLNDALSSSTAITPLSSGGGLIETRRNLRFAGRKQMNRANPHPFSDSLGKLPFQNFFLEAPGIPTNSKNYNDWKIYLAQQIRNVRYFVGEFGMNIKSLREFKAEAADLYRQYYEAIAAGDLSKLSKIIPSEKVYVSLLLSPPLSKRASFLLFFSLVVFPLEEMRKELL